MTTVVFDGKHLAADRQMTNMHDAGLSGGACKIEKFSKVLKATWEGDDYKFWGGGFAGLMAHADSLLKILHGERKQIHVLFNKMDCICRPDATVLLVGWKRVNDEEAKPVGLVLTWKAEKGIYRLKPTFHTELVAIGSGSSHADTMESCGIKSAVGYVQFARVLDKYSGGQIDWTDYESTMIHTLTIQDGEIVGGDVSVDEHQHAIDEIVKGVGNLRAALLGEHVDAEAGSES